MYDRLHRPKRLNCPKSLWRRFLADLRKRGRGNRESGGFLLGRVIDGHRFVEDYIAYDDIDPTALQGIILFDASRMDKVWRICAERGLSVVADAHTHPGGYGQSKTDRDNPMIPQAGHLALIIPNFADRDYAAGEIGVYEFQGRDRWRDLSAGGAEVLRLSWI
jgi:proteasome lid subunit RPN8/RPN11